MINNVSKLRNKKESLLQSSDTHRNKLIGIVQHSNEEVQKHHIGDNNICAQDCLS
jgi:hypothetical protein